MIAVYLFLIYLVPGLLFAIVFVTRGAAAVDADARGSGSAFRLMILPGAALLWPYLLTRWMKSGGAA